MSYTEMHLIGEDGRVKRTHEYPNGSSAMVLWMSIGAKAGVPFTLFAGDGALKPFWALHQSEKLAAHERTALRSTYDGAVCTDLLGMADAFEKASETLPREPSQVWHFPAMAVPLREAAAAGDIQAVGWTVTSVSGSVFDGRCGDTEAGENEHIPFDLNDPEWRKKVFICDVDVDASGR